MQGFGNLVFGILCYLGRSMAWFFLSIDVTCFIGPGYESQWGSFELGHSALSLDMPILGVMQLNRETRDVSYYSRTLLYLI